MRSLPTERVAAAGFSLLEAVVALAIVGFATVGVLEATAGALRARANLTAHAEAVALADAKLNELAALPRDSLEGEGSMLWREVSLDGHRYRWRGIVARDSAVPGLWRLIAEVEWPAGRFALSTRVYRPLSPGAALGRDRTAAARGVARRTGADNWPGGRP